MHFELAAAQERNEEEKQIHGNGSSSDSEDELSISLSDVLDVLSPSKSEVGLPKTEESDSERLELAEKGFKVEPMVEKPEDKEGVSDRGVIELDKDGESGKVRRKHQASGRQRTVKEEKGADKEVQVPDSQATVPTSAVPSKEEQRKIEQEERASDVEQKDRRFLPASILKRVSRSFDYSDTQTNASEPTSFNTSGTSSSSPEAYAMSKRKLTLRDIIHITMEVPQSSKVATIWMVFIMSLIVLSTLVFMLYSLPTYWLDPPQWMFIIEILCACVFTFEYITRLITSPVWYRWIISPFNVIDLIAILPFYIEIGFSATGSGFMIVRVVRLFRIFRMFRVGLYSSTVKVVTRALRRSIDGFLILLVGILLALCLYSSAIFYAEQTVQVFDARTQQWLRPDGSISPYQSIPDAFWWCLETLTTVGYGDSVPISSAGKVVGSLAMVTGLFVFAFPITVLSSNFTNVWNEHQESKKRKKENKKLRTMLTIYEDVPLHDLLVDLDRRQREIKEKIDQLTQAHSDLNNLVSELKIRSAATQTEGKWFGDRRAAEV